MEGVFCCLTPKENLFWQPPMDEHAFVDVWESCREVSPSHWRKTKPRLDSLKGRSKFHLLVLLLHQSCVAQCQERPSCPMIFPTRGRDNMWVSSQLPQLCRTLPKRPTLSCSVQNSCCTAEGWGAAGRTAKFLLGIRVMQVPLTASWTSSGSLPTNCWGHLSCRCPNWPTDSPMLHAPHPQIPTL